MSWVLNNLHGYSCASLFLAPWGCFLGILWEFLRSISGSQTERQVNEKMMRHKMVNWGELWQKCVWESVRGCTALNICNWNLMGDDDDTVVSPHKYMTVWGNWTVLWRPPAESDMFLTCVYFLLEILLLRMGNRSQIILRLRWWSIAGCSPRGQWCDSRATR